MVSMSNWKSAIVVRTVAVSSHDNNGKDDLECSQCEIEHWVPHHTHSHCIQYLLSRLEENCSGARRKNVSGQIRLRNQLDETPVPMN
jgi:hypothetical protein